jgi:FAD:protein FMN transferase
MIAQREIADSFACFGGTCGVLVRGDDEAATAGDAAALVRRRLLAWHDRFTRFDPQSELSRVKADPRPAVPVTDTMALLADAVRTAAVRTGGLVDGTLVGRLEAAGYRSAPRAPLPLEPALRLASARRPAAADPEWHRRALRLEVSGRLLRRPVGVQIDSGGLAKGLFADLLADALARHDAFAVDCAGDLRLGGTAGESRPVRVASPFHAGMLHTFEVAAGAAATSGIGRRSWLDAGGRPAHHILDPATGRPAFTGIVQATALAPTALDAEVRAKAALLSGPDDAQAWLRHGGVVVLDDGSHRVFPPA